MSDKSRVAFALAHQAVSAWGGIPAENGEQREALAAWILATFEPYLRDDIKLAEQNSD